MTTLKNAKNQIERLLEEIKLLKEKIAKLESELDEVKKNEYISSKNRLPV